MSKYEAKVCISRNSGHYYNVTVLTEQKNINAALDVVNNICAGLVSITEHTYTIGYIGTRMLPSVYSIALDYDSASNKLQIVGEQAENFIKWLRDES